MSIPQAAARVGPRRGDRRPVATRRHQGFVGRSARGHQEWEEPAAPRPRCARRRCGGEATDRPRCDRARRRLGIAGFAFRRRRSWHVETVPSSGSSSSGRPRIGASGNSTTCSQGAVRTDAGGHVVDAVVLPATITDRALDSSAEALYPRRRRVSADGPGREADRRVSASPRLRTSGSRGRGTERSIDRSRRHTTVPRRLL